LDDLAFGAAKLCTSQKAAGQPDSSRQIELYRGGRTFDLLRDDHAHRIRRVDVRREQQHGLVEVHLHTLDGESHPVPLAKAHLARIMGPFQDPQLVRNRICRTVQGQPDVPSTRAEIAEAQVVDPGPALVARNGILLIIALAPP
jgi:hypothetical protein